MCGIAGVIGEADPLVRCGIVDAMLSAMTHRGPDGVGRHAEESITLGMRRLSIIDLTGGWQPLYSEDKSIVVVANGEIYNHVELRKTLEAKGHEFSTFSDCEVIAHLYEDHGADFVDHLRGMFAIALWDSRRRRLILARDRMGEKPLYVAEQGRRILFASEMKGLLASGVVPFELDPVSLDLYFHFQYVPDPLTPVRGVRKLPAGSMLIVDVEGWHVTESVFWRIEDAPPLAGDAIEQLQATLEGVGALTVRSDVPIGIALSGGLDSSLVAALTAKHYPGSLHAFTVGYPGRPSFDERHEAIELAHILDIPIQEVEIDPAEMISGFSRLNYCRDDPIADISGHSYWMVMRAARQANIRVMMQGQGGDELFWGYDWVRLAARRAARKKTYVEQGILAAIGSLRMGLPKSLRRGDIRDWVTSIGGLRPALAEIGSFRQESPDRVSLFDRLGDSKVVYNERSHLYGPALTERLGCDPFRQFDYSHPWPATGPLLTKLICDTYLRENGIAQGDRLSMAESVELRLPLVDYVLAETAVGLRKVKDDTHRSNKALLRQAARTLLPDKIIKRKKRGFAPPVAQWHRGLFAEYGESLIGGELQSRGVLTPESCRSLSIGPYPTEVVTPISFKALVLENWSRSMATESRDAAIRYAKAEGESNA